MLTEVEIINVHRSELGVLELPIFSESRFPVQFIDGLSPADAEISSSAYANYDGEYELNTRVGTRNIVLTLELNPDWTMGEDPTSLREELYSFLSPGNSIEMRFLSDNQTPKKIFGKVETFEAPLFVQSPVVQVSIICLDPFFQSVTEFEKTNLMPGGIAFNIEYGGNIPARPIIRVHLLEYVDFIQVRSTRQNLGITIQGSFHESVNANGEYIFNPRKGQKFVGRGSNSLLHLAATNMEWPILYPGTNEIRVSTGGFQPTNVKVIYNELYTGL